MTRAEAIPVAGSRSTTEPPEGRMPVAPPPALGRAPTSQVTAPARPAGGGPPAVRPTVRLRPPAPAPPPYRGRAAVIPRRGDTPLPEIRTPGGSVTRRTRGHRGAVTARRLVGL
ncbi:hypothetical protein GCM10010109_30180 [Actinoplanes campanulatus]|nr:hypothetical protein GCM10010109_30180 [Actinoplanes campanulatus]GID38618.1 hypothetical protein Aca09nite_51240 [Actinoplanes campanulatus]